MSQLSVMQDVIEERTRQNLKWGVQNHEPCRWISILTEEVGEAAQAANDMLEKPASSNAELWGQEQEYRAELVQVAAVAIAMIENLDRNRSKRKQQPGE